MLHDQTNHLIIVNILLYIYLIVLVCQSIPLLIEDIAFQNF